MLYELTTLSCPPLTEGAVATAACEWMEQGPGQLLGVWRSEIGDLFQVKRLRGFETAQALEDERRRVERGRLRARYYAEGLWPPKGAPEQIARAKTMICLPEPYSPPALNRCNRAKEGLHAAFNIVQAERLGVVVI